MIRITDPERGWCVPRETRERLSEFCALVRRWNSAVQLVSCNDVADIERRHVGNSLVLVPLVAQLAPRSIMDIGSGAGFPGLVLAIVTGIPVELVEIDRRKAAFLHEVVRALAVDATVTNTAIESVGSCVDVVTSRAFAPLARLWNVAAPRIVVGGRGLFLYGDGETSAVSLVTLGRPALVWPAQAGTVVEMCRV